MPEAVSALPGAVRLWAYQREIADAIIDPEIERVALVKGVRVGFTTLLTGAIDVYSLNAIGLRLYKRHSACLALDILHKGAITRPADLQPFL